MFNKANSVDTLIGSGSICTGNLKVTGGVRIDGTVTGDIDADSVFLGEKGQVNGAIRAKTVDVGGRIEGNIQADDLVVIRAKGLVHGDIACTKLSIIEGGVFMGRAIMPEKFLNKGSDA
ncbi:MAG: polymer-forming cytoskeletal protein [Nitrospirae bacterium]|nr:polymer-forming cytoskeletal protein [Nitrospirota bacterium]